MIQCFIDLLYSNHNIILHGAPGTGKTYMAREIAKEMGAEVGFVQFHPSYDYTDFVEGLRPVQENGAKEIGFKRMDGVFKKFCKKALDEYNKADDKEKAPKFVFVIDEINRGDMSKIFGELFFSIDPGYRGEKGKVATQYQNLVDTEEDVFKDCFFVPENVYIIGTMNDIDRSVESMDFAMRRRFAFVEVEAKDDMLEAKNFKKEGKEVDGIDVQAVQTVKDKMNALNKVIWDGKESSVGLTKDYQIGGAYFLKYALYANEGKDEAFKKLWENHLESVLKEYLRGTESTDENMQKLATAYGYTKKTYKADNNG